MYMTFWSYSNIYLLANILLWLVAFIYYQKKRKFFGVGSFLLLFYLSIAAVGMHLFNQPLATGWFNEITIFPFLYLFIVIRLASFPILRFREENILTIQAPTTRAFNFIAIVIILFSLWQLPTIFSNFYSGMTKMLINSSAGKEMYLDTLSKADESGDGKISNLAAIISGMFSNVSILFLFYSLVRKEKNKYLIAGLLVSVILLVLSSVASGARGNVVNVLLTSVFTYLLLKNFMTNKIRKIVRTIGILMIVLVSIPFMLITISRFDKDDDFGTFFSMEWYYGQSFLNFNNYGLDAEGIRNGDRTAALFKQMIWDDVPRNYLERRFKYSYMKMDESVFYTFVGDFTLDYGPIITLFIFMFFSIFFYRSTRIRDNTLKFHQLISLYFVLCVSVQGAMTLFSFSDIAGNLNLVTFILTYFWFKFDYYLQQNMIIWQK